MRIYEDKRDLTSKIKGFYQYGTYFCMQKVDLNIKVLTEEELQALIQKENLTIHDFEVLGTINNKAIISYDLKNLNESVLFQTLPSNIYQTKQIHPFGLILEKANIVSDQYIDISNSIITDLYRDIQLFIENREKYHSLNLLHKRGVLLYGSAGNGKTKIILEVIRQYVEKCNIIQITSPSHLEYLSDLRELLSSKPTIFIIEELSYFITNLEFNSELLLFLDGENSWDGMLVLATTNYPEKLPLNIINRPSRFDRIIQIENPTPIMREKYLSAFIPKQITNRLINETTNFSIASLKEVCIQAILRNADPLQIVREMKEQASLAKKFFGNNSEYI